MIKRVFLLAVLSFGVLSAQVKRKDFKVSGVVKKEAKRFIKDGYYVLPGSLPLKKQLDKAYSKQFEENEKTGEALYIIGSGTAVAETQLAAKKQVMFAAKSELASKISTSITETIKSNISNAQLSAEEAASVTETVSAATGQVNETLGKVLTLLEIYRKTGKNIEATIRVGYNVETALEQAKKVIRARLMEKSVALEKINEVVGSDDDAPEEE